MAKIAQIEPKGTVDLQSGTFYKFWITLDNQEAGEVLAKSQDRWKVGDEVEAEINRTSYGMKMKLKKPEQAQNYSGGYSKGGTSPDKEKRITFLSCLSSAATYYSQRECTEEMLLATALRFTETALNGLNNPEPVQQQTPQKPPF